MSLQAIDYSPGSLRVLDQLRLPHEFHYDDVTTREQAFDCIRSMRVRGAPAIAIVAALALAVELHNGACSEFDFRGTHDALGPAEVVAEIFRVSRQRSEGDFEHH
jgi:methylthioribose-1-phosphate isomerase